MSTLTIQELMQQSGVAFGTSGARGLVINMTETVCAAYVAAFLTVVQRAFKVERVGLGMDLRPSSPDIAVACAKAIRQAGLAVDFCGALPTPALAFYAQTHQIPAIMVTGSHIPFDRNGIKFYRPDGEITKADELAMTALQVDGLGDGVMVSLPVVNKEAIQAYEQRYLDFFPKGILNGIRLGLYEHSSVARDTFKRILVQLGAEVISLERTEHFVPIDTEAVSVEDGQRGLDWSKQYGFDAIISTDGDGDRPLMSDERGVWLRGDIIGLLCARSLGVQGVVLPVSCNTAIEASGFFKSVLRTRIGSPYVIEGMNALVGSVPTIAGFEANGGFLAGVGLTREGKTLAPLPTRDAVLPVLTLLVAAKQQGVPISRLLADLPARFTASDRLQNIPTATCKALIAAWEQDCSPLCALVGNNNSKPVAINTLDGLRITFENGDIIHLRGSGNAPELRCYAEADTVERSNALVKQVLARVTTLV